MPTYSDPLYRLQYRLTYPGYTWVTLAGYWESLENVQAALLRHQETSEYNQPGDVEWRIITEVEVESL